MPLKMSIETMVHAKKKFKSKNNAIVCRNYIRHIIAWKKCVESKWSIGENKLLLWCIQIRTLAPRTKNLYITYKSIESFLKFSSFCFQSAWRERKNWQRMKTKKFRWKEQATNKIINWFYRFLFYCCFLNCLTCVKNAIWQWILIHRVNEC